MGSDIFIASKGGQSPIYLCGKRFAAYKFFIKYSPFENKLIFGDLQPSVKCYESIKKPHQN